MASIVAREPRTMIVLLTYSASWSKVSQSPSGGRAGWTPAGERGSAPVVVDDLDVVPVRVEHERAVVARVVDRALARRAVVLVARRERGGVERAHRGVLARGEREVDGLRERPLVPDEREAVVRAGQLHAAGVVVCQAQPGVRGDRRVEAPGGLRVADAQPQVVDAPVGHGGLAVAVDRLDAVAVGVEQEGAVVRRGVLRARPRPAVVAVARVDARLPERVDTRAAVSARAPAPPPACQNASTCARSRARKPTWRPRVTGCSRSVGPMSQSSHSTSSASAWLGSTPRTLRTVR